MLNSDLQAGVRVTVEAKDTSAEILVFLGTSELVAKSRGHLWTNLKPGLYTVQARTGFEAPQSKGLVIQAGDDPKTVEFPATEFRSPAPLSNTSSYRESHAQAATAESGRVHVEQGSDSWIFVFARDWSPTSIGPENHPAKGLTLRSLQGDLVVDLETQATCDLGEHPWAACNVRVDAGVYKLVLELPTGKRLSQLIVATLGWQTQVFLQQRAYNVEPIDRRADLPGAAILLAPVTRREGSPSFQPGDPGSRQVELARLGLLDHVPELGANVEQQIKSALPVDPMLIIYSANVLLRTPAPDLGLLRTLVAELRQRGLAGHPDVEALTIRLDLDKNAPPFQIPTMLRQSWNLVLRCSVMRPELVPLDSLAASVGERLWAEEPWLLWLESGPDQVADEAASRSAALQESLVEQLCRTLKRLRMRGNTEGSLPDMGATPNSVLPFLRQDEMEQLALTLGVPWNRIQDLVGTLEHHVCEPPPASATPLPKPAQLPDQLRRAIVDALLAVPGINDFQARSGLLNGIAGADRLDRDDANAYRDLESLVTQLHQLRHLDSGELGLLVLMTNATNSVEGFELAAKLTELRRQVEQTDEPFESAGSSSPFTNLASPPP